MMYINAIKNNFNTFQKNFLLKINGFSNVKKIFEKAFQAILSVSSYVQAQKPAPKTQVSTFDVKATSKKRKYLEYPRTLEQEKALNTVMEGMSSGGYFQIAKRAKSLYAAKEKINYEQINEEIHGVHPLRQLGYVCSKTNLKQMLKTIMGYTGSLAIVKTKYLQNMSLVLDACNKNNQIVPLIKDFVDEISKGEKLSNSQKNQLINQLTKIANGNDKNKWEAFILALI